MRLLRRGDKGDEVRQLQAALIAAGYQIAQDGDYGPATEQVVRRLQRDHNLVADGVVGSKTWAALGQQDDERLLSQADIERAAQRLDVTVPAVLAVNEVESRGNGFLADGRPVILFERHIMRRELVKNQIILGGLPADLVNAKPGGYLGGAREHDRLDRARRIHEPSAIRSASWGLFQIMGFHHELVGYDTPAAFEAAMAMSEGHQLDIFVEFVRSQAGMLRALQRQDWAIFARLYNGPAYAKNKYDVKMAAAFHRHQEA